MSSTDLFHKFPVLTTKRLVLRKLTFEDAADFYSYYSDEQVTKHLDWKGPSSIEHAKEVIQAWNNGYDTRMVIPWGIALQSDNKIIGTIPYIPLRGTFDWKPLLPTVVGFELSRHHWHQGLMSEALQAVIDYGFNKLGAHRIQAEVFPENTPSLNLLKKLGFQAEGLMQQYLFHEELKIFKDIQLLALLKR